MITVTDLHIDLGEFHLSNIALDVDENEFFIIMGPSGSGKPFCLRPLPDWLSQRAVP